MVESKQKKELLKNKAYDNNVRRRELYASKRNNGICNKDCCTEKVEDGYMTCSKHHSSRPIPKEISSSDLDKELVVLKEHYIIDLVKPAVDKIARASIIRSLMLDKGISARELSRRYGVSHSTVHDWLLYDKISESEYNDLVSKGFNRKQIYDSLREKSSGLGSFTDLDTFLVDVKNKAFLLRKHLDYTPRTMQLIDRAVDMLNQIGVDINLKEKNK